MDSRTEKLRTLPIPRLLASYGLPAMVGSLVMALYNIVDAIFIGRGVGELAIAGISISFPIFMFLQGFGMLIGSGASVRVSILLGEQKPDEANRVLGNSFLLTLFFSLSASITCFVFLDPLLRIFGASDQVFPYAQAYLRILIPGSILSTLSFSYNSVMRASGYPTKAMITMFLGAVLNTFFDALFIFVLKWGIEGAAWATILAMFCSMCFVMFHFVKPNSLIRLKRSAMKPSFSIMKSILLIGLAPFMLQIVGSVVNMILNRSFVAYAPSRDMADITIAIYGIVANYSTLFVMVVLGVSQGMQPIVGYNYGAGLPHRVIHCLYYAAGINTLVTIVGGVIALTIPHYILGLFKASPAMQEQGVYMFRMILWGFCFVGFSVTITQFFQSLGRSFTALFLSATRQVIYLIPGVLLLPHAMGLGGVFIAMPISDTLASLTALLMIIYQIKYGSLAKSMLKIKLSQES